MTHARRDGLPASSLHPDPDRRLALHGEQDGSFLNPKAAPGPFGNTVSGTQTGRQRVGLERPGCPGKAESLGQLGPVAEGAVEFRSEPSRPLGLVEDPWPLLEGRPMADVLGVQARQLGDPVAVFVLMKPDDGPLHALSLQSASA